MYCASATSVLVNWCCRDRLNIRSSGLWRWSEMGRTRPKNPLPGGTSDASTAGLGELGNAATTVAQPGSALVIVVVFSVRPSKFNESSTTLLKASMVTSAAEAFTRVPGRTSQVMPRRGCQLFLSEEQAEMRPLLWKQVPLGPLMVPPLKAPAS